MTYDITLSGCRPEPLMSYLKALGVLRLVSEQQDPGARAYWVDTDFQLQTTASYEGLLSFFLNEYKPTPIVTPWSGGSGFFAKDNRQFVDALSTSPEPRCQKYVQVIRIVRKLIQMNNLDDKPSDDIKARLLQQYRRELPDVVVEWIDAAMVLQGNGQIFAPLLGTGGNDGRLDFAQNFMGRLVILGIPSGMTHPQSAMWLKCALFGDTIRGLQEAAIGQFAPGRAGGPNATQGMEGRASDNPWDFVLMLEGALTLSGAAVRRLSAGENSRSAFPFTVRAVSAGYSSAVDGDSSQSRGEIWLPLWKRPATFVEIRAMFSEGRATVSGRPARTGIDFAQAVASFGVDRGLDWFSRYGFLKRSGKAYLASSLGDFQVHDKVEIDLLREIDPWLDAFRRAISSNDAPARLKTALHRIDEAIFEVCRSGDPPTLTTVLCALGNAERDLAMTDGWLTWITPKKRIQPLHNLSNQWVAAADDGSVEYELALGLAGIYDSDGKIEPLRGNLEPVNTIFRRDSRAYVTWAETNRSNVWNAAELSTNLVAVLERRMIDGERAGCTCLPVASRSSVSIGSVAVFLAGAVDETRIAELLRGLLLVNQGNPSSKVHFAELETVPLPRLYALLKLLFLPKPLVIEDSGEKRRRVRFAKRDESGVQIVTEQRVLALLRAGHVDRACKIAVSRLRGSGLSPMHVDWTEATAIEGRRLAAAMLIPVGESSIGELLNLVTRSEAMHQNTNVLSLTRGERS